MTKRSSSSLELGIGDDRVAVDSAPEADLIPGEPGFSFETRAEIEPPDALFERIAALPITGETPEWPPTVVPLLGHLVPGAERCAVLSLHPDKNQLGVVAVANFSQEFIKSLTCEGPRLITALAKQVEPHLVIYLPRNKQFASLWKFARLEGIKTIWLIPWNDSHASIAGAFLFASPKAFSPSKETIASVTLLAASVSLLRQIGGRRENESPNIGNRPGTEKGDGDIAAVNNRGSRVSYVQDGRSHSPFHEHAVIAELSRHDGECGEPALLNLAVGQAKQPDAVSVLSHELLSPLTLIKGYTATLLKLGDITPAEQKLYYLKRIESATDRVIRLMTNFRDLTALEKGNNLMVEPISLTDLVGKTVMEIQSQTTKHTIKFIAHGSVPPVKVDPLKMEQVMTNLLMNALKYSPHGGDILIEINLAQSESELVELCGEVSSLKLPSVIVSVSDHGVGIPEEELKRVFERFYRVNNKVTRVTPGAGLGLYICKIIAEAHGGCIWARNRVGGGCVFSFSIPLIE